MLIPNCKPFYLIQDCYLVDKNKGSGFNLFLIDDFVKDGLKIEIMREDFEKIIDITKMNLEGLVTKKYLKNLDLDIVFLNKSIVPRSFSVSGLGGVDLSIEGTQLDKVINSKDYPEWLYYYPHNLDSKVNGLILLFLVQSWIDVVSLKLGTVSKPWNSLGL